MYLAPAPAVFGGVGTRPSRCYINTLSKITMTMIRLDPSYIDG